MIRFPKTWTLLEDTKVRVRSGMIAKPVWFDHMVNHPPLKPTRPAKGWKKPKQVEYPENRLRKIFLKRNPEMMLYPLRQHPFENSAKYALSSPADIFASKQIQMMQQRGLREEEAYVATERWMKERQYATDLEIELLNKKIGKMEEEFPGINARESGPLDKLRSLDEPEVEIEDNEEDILRSTTEDAGETEESSASKEVDALTPFSSSSQGSHGSNQRKSSNDFKIISDRVGDGVFFEKFELELKSLRGRRRSESAAKRNQAIEELKYKLYPRERDPLYFGKGEKKKNPFLDEEDEYFMSK